MKRAKLRIGRCISEFGQMMMGCAVNLRKM